MHPIMLHASWLARQVEMKLAGVKVTPESLEAAIDELCANESPLLRRRVASEVNSNLISEKECDEPQADYMPKPRIITRQRSKTPSSWRSRSRRSTDVLD